MTTPLRTQENIDAQIAQLERELLELKRQRNELSPVSAIPPEVLCQILLLATSYPHDTKSFIKLQERFRVERCIGTLCHVSHSWRTTALGCPQLWTDIDIRMATDERKVDFMVKHAHPLAISLNIHGTVPESSARRYGQLQALDPVIKLLSGGVSFEKLALSGSLSLLTELLQIAQPSTLKALQIVVSDKRSLGYTAAGASISQHPLFTCGASELRTLSLEGCAIPLTSPILLGSPHLTSLSLHVQRESSASHLLDMLKTMRHVRRLNLDFRGPFSTSLAALNPVHLPFLTDAVLRGDSGSVITTVSNLRLSTTSLNLNLYCVFRNRSNVQPAGAMLFRALGRARCLPQGICMAAPSDDPFSPQLLGLGRPPYAQGPDGVCTVTMGNWMSQVPPESDRELTVPAAAVSIVFLDQSTSSHIHWSKWHPLMLANHPSDMQLTTGWSMDALFMFGFHDDGGYPDSFWRFLSECPKILDLAIAASHVPKLIPHLSVNEVNFPFPSLARITVEGATSQNATAEQTFESHLEVLLQALRSRRTLSKKYHGVEKKWVLEELGFDRYVRAPSQSLVHAAQSEGLVGRIAWGEE